MLPLVRECAPLLLLVVRERCSRRLLSLPRIGAERVLLSVVGPLGPLRLGAQTGRTPRCCSATWKSHERKASPGPYSASESEGRRRHSLLFESKTHCPWRAKVCRSTIRPTPKSTPKKEPLR